MSVCIQMISDASNLVSPKPPSHLPHNICCFSRLPSLLNSTCSFPDTDFKLLGIILHTCLLLPSTSKPLANLVSSPGKKISRIWPLVPTSALAACFQLLPSLPWVITEASRLVFCFCSCHPEPPTLCPGLFSMWQPEHLFETQVRSCHSFATISFGVYPKSLPLPYRACTWYEPWLPRWTICFLFR